MFQYVINWSRFNGKIVGMEEDQMSQIVYARAAQRINAAMKIIATVEFPVPFLYLLPFVLVFCHWCLGKYTIDSWFLYYSLWWVRIKRQVPCNDSLPLISFYVLPSFATPGHHLNWTRHFAMQLSFYMKCWSLYAGYAWVAPWLSSSLAAWHTSKHVSSI